ncbi:MAG: hypothetical protein CMB80_07280 [Flammeovirgaceae bacterium]|nr:hypothetical protein [Flammeovirgaceae bacterium]MBR06960.1 hypothetical protein [Rickettsiales bacterium]HCX22368.1 hypothetical protein [Cytophagales bacterium]|tara:strand:+ start:98 stop:484 length:387 start_codon:yes stop_codon:yes gene_type:complete
MRAEDRILIKNLAQTAEIVNTINGGMSQANMILEKGEDEWTVAIRVPGVSPERMRVEVRNGQLFIFHVMADENAAEVELPFLLAAVALDKRVDFDAIIAEYEDKELFITMPLDEEASGYEREIDIFKR